MRGLLSPLNDPAEMARIAERNRIIEKIGQQTGATRSQAFDLLWHFENVTSSEGQDLH
jgi:hypothetical protein